jgi:hypothetical protein
VNTAAKKRSVERSSVVETRRPRNKAKTLQALEQAIVSLQGSGQKVGFTAVAREVGIDPSAIHKVYPDLAEKIRSIAGKGTRKQRDQALVDLAKAKLVIKELRSDLQRLQLDLARIASLNETLGHENAKLTAELAGKVATLVHKRCEKL